MKLLRWKKLVRNTLRGFADIELEIGLVLRECPVRVEANGRPWVGLAAKVQVDRDGNTRRDPHGKPLYSPVCEWRDRATRDRFSDYAIKTLLAHHPDALAAADPPARSAAPDRGFA